MTEQAQEQTTPETDENQEETQEQKNLTWEEHQRELRRVGKKEKSEGRNTERAALLEALGVDDLDAAKEMLDDYRYIQEAAKTEDDETQEELEKAREETKRLKAEKQEALQLADARLVDSELKSALISEGVDAKRVKKILRDPDIEKPSVEDGEVDGVSEYVEAAKKEWPELFSRREHVPESPAPSNGANPEQDARAKADFQRQYARNF